MSKTLLMEVKLKNLRLIKAREELNLTPKQAANAIGVPYQTYLHLESIKKDPRHKINGYYSIAAIKVSEYFGYPLSYFFNADVLSVKNSKVVKEVNKDEIALAFTPQKSLEPQESLEYSELSKEINLLLKTLTAKEQSIVELRFGLNNKRVHEFYEIGLIHKVCESRAREILKKAIRKLRHPCRTKRLLEFVNEDLVVDEKQKKINDFKKALKRLVHDTKGVLKDDD